MTLRSRPVENPWLIDLDALVTPPVVDSGSIAIDVVRHRVRAGTGADWVGRTGHIEIGPEQIAVRDLASASPQGRIALAGSYERAGRRAGDLAANLDIKGLALDNLGKVYHGTLDSHIAVARRGRAWSGDIAVDATGVAVDASPPPGTTARASQRATGTPLGASVASSVGSGATPIAASLAGALAPAVAASAVHAAPPPAAQRMLVDAHVHGKLGDRKLAMTIEAASRGVGSAQVAVELDTPVVITDGKAWQRLGRSAIRTGRVQLHGIELARLAQLAELEGPYGGRIDGDIQLSQTTVGGKIAASKVTVPRLRGMTGVDVMLDLSQPSPSELAPRLTAAIAGVGQVTAEATLGTPDRLLDPAAWAALGPRALHTASLHATDVAIDPAMLDRFGVVSDLRGKLSVAVDVGEAGQSVKATVAVTGLRGDPIVEPIDVKITAATGDRETTAAVAIAARGATLLDLETKIPGSAIELVRQLQTDPAAAKSTRLAASAKLASVDAPKLLAMLGSTEIVAGKLDGDIELGGTFGVPTATARLTATGLETRPNTRYKGKSVEKLALTASWDGHAAKLALDGSETEGGLLKLSATVDPKALADGSVTVVATKLDLAPLLAFVPGPGGGASGLLDANLTLKGLDVRTTQLTGEAHLTEARVPIAPTVGTLRQAKIDAVIANRELKLKIDGRLGGGTLSVDGSVALAGASPNSGKAKLTLRKVSPIGAVEPTISADVTAELAHEANQWRATLVVDHGFIVVPHDRGEKLKPAGMPTDMAFANGSRGGNRKPKTQAAPVNPIFLVKVTLHSTSVESDEFRGNIKGQLDVSANGDAFGITGGIDADRGDLDLFGRRYYVERAGVHFDGSLDPLLDVRISHDFTDVTTVTEVRGRVSKPELTLTSDPGSYSQSELLGFLLGGDPGGDAPGAGSDRVADAGASLVANKLGGYIRDALPIDIDVLRYEAATAATSAAVTVGTWIGHSLFLAYRQHLEARQDENLGEGEVEYWLSRRVMLEGTAGDRGYNGLDLLWRKRY